MKKEIMKQLEAIAELTYYKNGADQDAAKAYVDEGQASELNYICMKNNLSGNAVELENGSYHFVVNITASFN
jgi:hypothetical protein